MTGKKEIKSWGDIRIGSYYKLSENAYSGLTEIAAGTKVISISCGTIATCLFAVLEGTNSGLLIYEYDDDDTSSPSKYIPIDVLVSSIPKV